MRPPELNRKMSLILRKLSRLLRLLPLSMVISRTPLKLLVMAHQKLRPKPKRMLLLTARAKLSTDSESQE